jgi:hypothetical protein
MEGEVEVLRQTVEGAKGGDICGEGADSRCLDPTAGGRISETGDASDLVVPGEGLRHRPSYRSVDTADEYPLARGMSAPGGDEAIGVEGVDGLPEAVAPVDPTGTGDRDTPLAVSDRSE